MIRKRGSVPIAENISAYRATRSVLFLLGTIIFRYLQKYRRLSNRFRLARLAPSYVPELPGFQALWRRSDLRKVHFEKSFLDQRPWGGSGLDAAWMHRLHRLKILTPSVFGSIVGSPRNTFPQKEILNAFFLPSNQLHQGSLGAVSGEPPRPAGGCARPHRKARRQTEYGLLRLRSVRRDGHYRHAG